MPDCQAEASSSFPHEGEVAGYRLVIELDTPGHKLKITTPVQLCQAHKDVLRTIKLSGNVQIS